MNSQNISVCLNKYLTYSYYLLGTIILLCGIFFNLETVHAQNPTVQNTNPINNALNVATTNNISASFSLPISSSTVSTATFTVRGNKTGIYAGLYTLPIANMIQFDPSMSFKIGEVINVSISTVLESTGAFSATPYQWQFHASVAGGVGYFANSEQALGSSYAVALGDIDHDGDLDAFVANYGQANKVWLNNGSGTFVDSGQSLGNSDSQGVSLGDVDGDGDMDAFVANISSQANTVWLNDGNGTFSDSGQALGSSNSQSMSLGDVDDDGDMDAFVANYGQANKVWLNNGNGTFSDSGQSLGSSYSYGMSLADVNGDGDLDAFVVNFNSQANKVWLNDGNGTFSDSGQSLGGSWSSDVSLGDVDGDGNLDAFVANVNQANKLWLNDGNGTFSDSGQSLDSSNSKGVYLGDLDGDGDLDAYVANLGQTDKVWLNDGSGTFSDSGQYLNNSSSRDVSLGDMDGDGDMDAFVANNAGVNLLWLNGYANVEVTNINDSGAGSLRQAIIDLVPGGVITFSNSLANQTIILSSQLTINKDMTISGTMPITISGGGNNRVFDINSGITVTLANLNITDGYSNFTWGGGVGIRNYGITTLRNMTIYSNTLNYNDGGGILNYGDMIIENSTIANNSGGGINNDSGTLTITNTTISHNYWGGLNINGGTVDVSNSIIANSINGSDCNGSLNININNLIEDGTCSPTISGDPMLDSLQNNGGNTLSMALLPGSPAINVGDVATCLSTDQHGNNRVWTCDIGSYEFDGILTDINMPTLDLSLITTYTIASDVTLDVQNVMLSSMLDYNGLVNGTLTINATENITIAGNIYDSVVGGDYLNLILNADSDNISGGVVSLISATIETQGGDFTAAGTGINDDVGIILDNVTLDSSTGNITLTSDEMNLTGSTTIAGSGTLAMQPETVSQDITIGGNGTSDTTFLNSAELDMFSNGFIGVIIGHESGSGTITIDVDSFTCQDPLTIQTADGLIITAGSIAEIDNCIVSYIGDSALVSINTPETDITINTDNRLLGDTTLTGNNIILNGSLDFNGVGLDKTLTISASENIIISGYISDSMTGDDSLNVVAAISNCEPDSAVMLNGNTIETQNGVFTINSPSLSMSDVQLDTSDGNITFLADDIDLTGTTQIAGTSTMQFRPHVEQASNLFIDGSNLSTLADGFTQIIIGETTSNWAITLNGNSSILHDPLLIQSLSNTITIDTSITTDDDGTITLNGETVINADLSTDGQAITLNGNSLPVTINNVHLDSDGGNIIISGSAIHGNGLLISDGGDIVASTDTDMVLGGVNASGISIGGSVTLTATNDITASYINTQGASSGAVAVTAGQFIHLIGKVPSSQNSVDTFGTSGGAIVLQHGGNGFVPFIVGGATTNGSLGKLSSGTSQIESGEFYYDHSQGNIQIIAIPSANITIAKHVTPTTTVDYHGQVTYTIVVSNTGGNAIGVIISDTLPSNITFSHWISQPNNATFDNNQLLWNGNLLDNETIEFVFVASHVGEAGDVVTNTAHYQHVTNSGSDDAIFSVDNKPTISAIADQSMNEDETLAFSFTVADIETDVSDLTLTVQSSNTSLVPNSNIIFDGVRRPHPPLGGLLGGRAWFSHTMTITPVLNMNGSTIITITVNDGKLSESTSFTLIVNPVADAPTISSIPAQTTFEEMTTSVITFTIGDIDTSFGNLTVDAQSENTTLVAQSGMVLGGTGANRTLTITPRPEQMGSTVITVTVQDESNLTASIAFSLTVYPMSDAPTISDITNQTTNEDITTEPIVFTVMDVDTEISALIITSQSSNQALVPHANFEINYNDTSHQVIITPMADMFGMAIITMTVTDESNLSASDSFTLTVNAINDAPTIHAPADQSTRMGVPMKPITFTVADVDTPTNVLSVTAQSDNPLLVPDANINISGNDSQRTITITPTEHVTGTVTINLAVTDGMLSAEDSFGLVVSVIPTMSDIPDQETEEDISTDQITFTIHHLGNKRAILSAKSSDTWLVPIENISFSGEGESKTVTVIPGANRFGSAEITVTAHIGNLTLHDSFILEVESINDRPTLSAIADHVTAEDVQTDVITMTIGDVETNVADLEMRVTSSNQALMPDGNIELAGYSAIRRMTLIPLPEVSGMTTLTVTVGDGLLNSVGSFKLYVNPVNDAPLAVDDSIIIRESNATINVLENDSDIDSTNLHVENVMQGTHGTVGIEANMVVYSANIGFIGDDHFTYTISDEYLNDTANITVSVRLPMLNINPKNLSFIITEGEGNPAPQTFIIGNEGDETPLGASKLALTKTWLASTNLEWLTLSSYNGIVQNQEIIASVDATALTAGTYYGQVDIFAEGTANNPQSISIILSVNPSDGSALPPVISHVDPTNGVNTKPTLLTIFGSNFDPNSTVKLDNMVLEKNLLPSPRRGGAVGGVTQLLVEIPTGLAVGNYDVSITNPNGQEDILLNAFTVFEPTPPTISEVTPSQGVGSQLNSIEIHGTNFVPGATAKLSAPELDDVVVKDIWNVDSTLLKALVPVNIQMSPYTLTVINPNEYMATLPNAYQSFDAEHNDLWASPDRFWLNPMNFNEGDENTGIGLVVYRRLLAEYQELNNLEVTFYVDSLDSPLIGASKLALTNKQLLPIGTGIITSFLHTTGNTNMVEWQPSEGKYVLYAVIDPYNKITEFDENNNIISRTVTIFPQIDDDIAPIVTSFSTNRTTGFAKKQQIKLSATASDNHGGSGIYSMYYSEYAYDQSILGWAPVANSGWLPYQEGSNSYRYVLSPIVGVHYLQVLVADKAGNISEKSKTLAINYIPASNLVAETQSRLYVVNLTQGQTLKANVDVLAGDADIYIWDEDNENNEGKPDYISNQDDLTAEEIIFMATEEQEYIIQLHGYFDSLYQLYIDIEERSEKIELSQKTNIREKPLPSPPVQVREIPEEDIAVPSPLIDATTVDEQPDTPILKGTIYLPLILKNWIAPPCVGDSEHPIVDSFTINDENKTTMQLGITLSATASDTGKCELQSIRYIESTFEPTNREWQQVKMSDWLDYDTANSDYAWTLTNLAGVHKISAQARDTAWNISENAHQIESYINYRPPTSDMLPQGQYRLYWRELEMSQVMTVTITPSTGDPNLYIVDTFGIVYSDTMRGLRPERAIITATLDTMYHIYIHSSKDTTYQFDIVVKE